MKNWKVLALVGIVLFVLVSHLGMLNTPWDWDEPVYTNIASSVSEVGHPALNTNTGETRWYTFHPPFHFYALAISQSIFGENITAGRVVSSLSAILLVIVAMIISYQITGSDRTALLVGALLAIDGWFSYTTILVKLDGTATLLIALGVLFWHWNGRSDIYWSDYLAGFFLGLAAAYKHVAIIGILAVIIHWIITRKEHQKHLVILGVSGAILVTYITAMLVFVGDPYINATEVQIRRSLGLQESRGLNYGMAEVIRALVGTYWPYIGSLLSAGCAGLLAIWYGNPLTKRHPEKAILASWVLAAGIILVFVKIRNPHYLVYLIVPSTILVGIELSNLWQTRRKLATIFLSILVLLHGSSFVIRFAQISRGNALEQTEEFFAQLDPNWVVVSEETVCAAIAQPCYKIGLNQTQERLDAIDPDFIVVYTSLTQRPPDSEALTSLISSGQEVRRFGDWKATISVIEIE